MRVLDFLFKKLTPEQKRRKQLGFKKCLLCGVYPYVVFSNGNKYFEYWKCYECCNSVKR